MKINDEPIKRLVKIKGGFPSSLRKVMDDKKVTVNELSTGISRLPWQVMRYRGEKGEIQYPQLKTFIKMCLILQVDPAKLLGLKWVDARKCPDPEMIYIWKMSTDNTRLYWECPVCEKRTVTYGDWNKIKGIENLDVSSVTDMEKLKVGDYTCDNCYTIFSKLYGL